MKYKILHPATSAILSFALGVTQALGGTAQETLGFVGNLSSTANGTPFSGNVDIKVSLYDLAAAGTLLHSECFANTQVTDGSFGARLGSASPFTPSLGQFMKANPALFVEVQVCDAATSCASGCDDPLTPRLAVSSAPFAGLAAVADDAQSLQGLTPTQLLQITGNSSAYTISQSNLDKLLQGTQDASSLHNHDSLYAKLGSGGNLSLGSGAYLGLGARSSDPTGFTTADAGKTWYDSNANVVKFWDGTKVKTLGTEGGLTGITLTGDISASGSGTLSASVVKVGGVAAADVASGANAANSATDANTPDTIVKRDSSGNFTAGTITATGVSVNGNAVLTTVSNLDASKITSGTLILGSDPTAALGAATRQYVDAALTTKQNSLGYTPVDKAGDTMAGTLSLIQGTTSVAPLKLKAGTNLTTPMAGAVEFNGTNLFFTNSSNARQKVCSYDSAAAPNSGDVLTWNGTAWAPAATGVTGTLPISGGGTGATTASSARAALGVAASGPNSDITSLSATTSITSSTSLTLGSASNGNIVLSPNGTGKVGVGTTAPASALDVAGSVRVGSDAGTCSTTNVGAIRYNSGNLDYCNGSGWSTLGVSGAGISALNGLTASSQSFAIGTAGNSPAFSSAGGTHTLNIPLASTASVAAGLLSNTDYTAFSSKLGTSTSFNGDVSGYYNTLTLANSGVTAGTYTRATITVDAKGRLTSAADGSLVNLASEVTGSLPITKGGTGATTAAAAVASLGAAPASGSTSIATVGNITTGTWNGTAIAIAKGGTGATTAAGAAANLLPYLLPSQPGNTGKYLTTDGSSLSWGSPAASSQWTTAGSDIYYNTGKVGIGTAAPNGALSVLQAGGQEVMLGGGATTGSEIKFLYPSTTHFSIYNSGNGRLTFADTSSSNTTNTPPTRELMVLTGDANNGKVGIGTTAPSAPLEVSQSTTGETVRISNVAANALMKIGSLGDGTGMIVNVTDGANTANKGLVFATGGTERLRVAATSGKIGIGKPSPSYELDVTGTIAASAGLQINGYLNTYSNKVGIGTQTPGSKLEIRGTGATASSSSLNVTDSSGNSKLFVRDDGSVGIGTNSPTGIFEVQGGSASFSAGADIKLVAQSTIQSGSQGGSIFLMPGAPGGGGSHGAVGIGTTQPTGTLEVSSPASNLKGLVVTGTTGQTANLQEWGITGGVTKAAVDSSGNVLANPGTVTKPGYSFYGEPGTGIYKPTAANIALAIAGTEKVRIDSNGNVGIGTNSPSTKLQVDGVISPSADNTYSLGDASLRFTEVYAVNGTIQTSDARQKKDIQESDLGLEFINKLRPVSYHWNNGADSDLHYGLIAQEAAKAIKEAKDQAGTQNPDAEGTIVTHDPASDRYGLKYSELIAPVIKAIQQLYSQIMDQESHHAAQDRELAMMKEQKADKSEMEALKAENAQIKSEYALLKAWACEKDPSAPFCR